MQIDKPNRRGRFVATGARPPEEAVELVASALDVARSQDLRTVLCDCKSMTLTRRMSVTECHHVGERLARAGMGLARLAFLVDEPCPDPHDFVLTVATNRGLAAESFEDERRALDWLDQTPK